MPILGDASIGDAVDVGGNEIDRLALALDLLEEPCEVTTETQVRDDTITGNDHLLDLAADIRDREAYQLRGCQRSCNSLRATGRQRLVDKIWRKRRAAMTWASACSLGKLRSTIRLCGSSSGVSAARVYITGAENISAIAVENTKARTRVSPEMSLVPGRFQMIFPLKMDLNRSPYYVCSRPFTEIYVLSEQSTFKTHDTLRIAKQARMPPR